MTPQPDDQARVAADLLAYARRYLGQPGLSYVEPPAPLPGGRDTDVYAFRFDGIEGDLAGPLVLRLFPAAPEGVAERRVRFEAAVHRAIAQQGFPVPAVLLEGASDAIDGRRFLVMQRVPGKNMVDSLISRQGPRMGARLAEAHLALHRLDVSRVRDALHESIPELIEDPDRGVQATRRRWAERLHERGVRELDRAFDWLGAHEPRPGELVVCHGDFHPLNVLIDRGGVTGVVDWADARIGHPAYDVTRASILVRHAPVEGSSAERLLIGAVRRALHRQYLRAYLRARPIGQDLLSYYEVLNATTMLAKAAEARLDGRDYTWRDPDAAMRLVRLIAARTGGAVPRAEQATSSG